MRFIPRFSITNAIAAALTEIERARGFLDAASLSDEWIDSMRSRAFLLEAHHTTHMVSCPSFCPSVPGGRRVRDLPLVVALSAGETVRTPYPQDSTTSNRLTHIRQSVNT